MMTHENLQTTPASPLFALRGLLRKRAGIVLAAALAIGGGLYFGWGYVLAAGLAPLILAVAPCAAMCAFGLCMGGGHKKPQDKVT
jgi:hypothetical protein